MNLTINHLRPDVSKMTPEQKQLWESCQGMEQVFLEILLKQMQPTLKGGLFPESMQRDIYDDMYRQALAEQMAKSGDVGLAAILYRQLQQQQQS
ncbi:MAG: flagellar biosynthesis protein FlgJ [Firmicutes bacterium]|nr:flagellar biosynthesis protein FlgJ [Bacillota bacterium]